MNGYQTEKDLENAYKTLQEICGYIDEKLAWINSPTTNQYLEAHKICKNLYMEFRRVVVNAMVNNSTIIPDKEVPND